MTTMSPGDSKEVRRAFVVRGRVQGVGFRWSAAERARSLGVAGVVWNRADGAVEAHVRGSAQAVEALRRWLERGPPAARVQEVEEISPGPEAGGEGFRISRRQG